ncbi:MAG: tetratricopeptide repeat-containing sensor histidine kinase [Candidatus Cloacimonetes bacterium]|nr:tetratricopeptide repeat-containing sensor histidine kinase [Candidatus Cloacimonadota bacterium]
MKKCFFRIFLFWLFTLSWFPTVKALSADTAIDSLKNELEMLDREYPDQHSLKKLSILTKLADYHVGIPGNTGLEFLEEALLIARENEQHTYEAILLNLKGTYFYFNNDLDKALNSHTAALKISEEYSVSEEKGRALNFIGIIYSRLGNLENAFDFLKKAEKIFRETDNLKRLSQTLNSLAGLYFKKEDYQNALEYCEKNLEIGKETNDENETIATYNNMGMIYNYMGDYDSALKYHEMSLDLKKKKGNITGLIISHINIGSLYSKKNDFQKSIEYLSIAEEMSADTNNKELISNINKGLAEIYFKMGEAEDSNLSAEYFRKALSYYFKYDSLRDSLFTEDKNRKIAELETQYEYLKKEKEIEELKNENTLKDLEMIKNRNYLNLVRMFVIIFLASVTVVFVILYQKARFSRELKVKNDELQTINKRLRESEKNLQEINASKDIFFSIIAHDLKNPFTAMLGLTELLRLRMNSFDKKDLLESITVIHESALNLYKLLENLLQWARTQTGKIDFFLKEFSIRDSIINNLTLLRDVAKAKDITMDISVESDFLITADINMFNAIIRNLVSNAIKFTANGGNILIAASDKDDYFEIVVKDNGIGMNEENLNKLFKVGQHFSTKGTANEIGTGLGLILCKEFIKKHNGDISVKSKIGEGAAFTITLPKLTVNS